MGLTSTSRPLSSITILVYFCTRLPCLWTLRCSNNRNKQEGISLAISQDQEKCDASDERLLLITVMVLIPAIASAQSETNSNMFWDVTKSGGVRSNNLCAGHAVLYLDEDGLGQLAAAVPKRVGRAEPPVHAERPAQRHAGELADGNRRSGTWRCCICRSPSSTTWPRISSSACSPQVPAASKVVQGAELGRTHRVRIVRVVCRVGEPLRAAERNRQLALQYGYR